jgi:hypothetical protein
MYAQTEGRTPASRAAVDESRGPLVGGFVDAAVHYSDPTPTAFWLTEQTLVPKCIQRRGRPLTGLYQ